MTTSQRQISLFTAEPSTCSAADSPASHTARPASEKEKKTRAISGPKCLEQFERFNRATSWAKMFAGSLIGTGDWYSTKCKLTWKLKATKCSRFYFQLVPSMRRIEEIESGLLPTPLVNPPNRKLNKEGGNKSAKGQKYGVSLPQLANSGMLPTPTARDYKGARSTDALENSGRNETNSLPDSFHQTGKTSQLNPRFVAEMMGFPPNWTELPWLNGETSPSKATEMP